MEKSNIKTYENHVEKVSTDLIILLQQLDWLQSIFDTKV